MSCSRTQRSNADEAQTRGPSVSSQALYHCSPYCKDGLLRYICVSGHIFKYFTHLTMSIYAVGTQKNHLSILQRLRFCTILQIKFLNVPFSLGSVGHCPKKFLFVSLCFFIMYFVYMALSHNNLRTKGICPLL